MTLLFAGGEDIDFALTDSATVTLDQGFFFADRARCAILIRSPGGAAATLAAPTALAWFSAQVFPAPPFNAGGILAQFMSGATVVAQIGTIASGCVTISVRDATGVLQVVATSAVALIPAKTRIDVKWQLASAGAIRVIMAGGEMVSYAGNTLGDLPASTKIDTVVLRNPGVYSGWSEVIVADTDTRAMRLVTLRPITLHQSDWSGTVEAVNEVQVDDTALANASTIGQTFNYNVSPLPAGTTPFAAVAYTSRIKSDGALPAGVEPGLISGSAHINEAAIALSDVFQRVNRSYTIDPSTNRPWSPGSINNMKFSFRAAEGTAGVSNLLLDDQTILLLEDGSSLSI